jgi:glutaminyl-tRNA synthetase
MELPSGEPPQSPQSLRRVGCLPDGAGAARLVAMSETPTAEPTRGPDFIRERIIEDNRTGVFGGRVQTRFPPEPNGYLHVGHAKSICLNFDLAAEFGGVCNLRFDDTNPATENTDFVTGIIDDVRWLGFDPRQILYASDYFEQLYDWACHLIRNGLAYVDDQDADTISANRGGFTTPGVDSPFRTRSVEENLDLFARMRDGEFPDGARVLRARIDMAHPNPQLRDPVLYRIRHLHHHRTGDAWCIYPTYDWAHGQSDAIEGVTHSLCTLEFDVHRPLYDWFLDQLPLPGDRPYQTEFARLQLTHTVLSKRKLAQLVSSGDVSGWDDARMPTVRGLRRRGYPPEALRAFCSHISVAKSNSVHDIELLEHFVRDELNRTALRRMAVLRPLKLVVTSYPEAQVELMEATENPEDPAAGTRKVPFTRELWIEAEDFMEDPPPKFFRLAPGREVRLRSAYFVTCTDVVRNASGDVVEIHCVHDPETLGGNAPDGRKVKATIHWVSAAHAVDAEVRLYDRLFTDPHPDSHDGRDPLEFLNPASVELCRAKVEPILASVTPGERVQFERLGYFCADLEDPAVFHRTVGLRDDWAKIQKRSG